MLTERTVGRLDVLLGLSVVALLVGGVIQMDAIRVKTQCEIANAQATAVSVCMTSKNFCTYSPADLAESKRSVAYLVKYCKD